MWLAADDNFFSLNSCILFISLKVLVAVVVVVLSTRHTNYDHMLVLGGACQSVCAAQYFSTR